MRFIYLNQDGETTGPFTGQEVREAVAAGRATSETPACTEGAKEWQPVGKMLAALANVQEHANAQARESASFEWVTLRLIFDVALFTGAGVAFYYGLMFDPAASGVNNVGLLNDRLCGVICGCALALLAALLLLLQALRQILAELKIRK